MNPLSSATLTLQDIPRLVSKHKKIILVSPLLGLVLFLSLAFVLPNKYKVHFVLTIDPKFFQNPLIGEFVPTLSSMGEMRSQGESLLRQALTPEFVDMLGTQHGIYTISQAGTQPVSLYQRLRTRLKFFLVQCNLYDPPSNDHRLPAERENLLSAIDIYSVYNTTFDVGFSYSDPDIAFRATQDIHAQMIQVLLDMRKRNLINFRDAIERRLASLTHTLQTASSSALSPAATTPPVIQEQLEQTRAQIASLSIQYTEEHPLMQELRTKERALVSRLEASKESGRPRTATRPAKSVLEGDANREVYSDLSRKLNYLNIAIDSDQERQGDYFATLSAPLYPTSPLWPKKPLFALWGFCLGLFVAVFSAAIREYFDRSALHAETLAHHLGIPLLGHLPAFPIEKTRRTPLIESPEQKSTARR